MGLFGGTKTYVASSVYNLAGDEDSRPNFIGTVIVTSVLSSDRGSLAGRLQSSLFNSTAMRQRRFFRWAQDNYQLGMPVGRIGAQPAETNQKYYDGLNLEQPIPSDFLYQIYVKDVVKGEIEYWADAHVFTNGLPSEWEAVFLDNTNEIRITFEDPGTDPVTFPAPADLLWAMEDPSRSVLLMVYRVVTAPNENNEINSGGVGLNLGFVASDPLLFSYRIGSGNIHFDDLGFNEDYLDEFFPPLMMRLKNKSIRDPEHADIFENTKTAFRKLTGGNINDLLDNIEDNEDLDDIDHCFLVQGVSLNTKEKTAKQYMYKFFKDLLLEQIADTEEEQKARERERVKSQVAWDRWERANLENGKVSFRGGTMSRIDRNPQFGTAPPAGLTIATGSKLNELRITMTQLAEFDMRIRWTSISETQHWGNAKRFDGDATRPKLKIGDYWTRTEPIDPRIASKKFALTLDGGQAVNRSSTYRKDGATLEIYHQYAKNRYSKLVIRGLLHKNNVYRGYAVYTSAHEAFQDEDESGFIIPLRYDVLREMGLVKGAQMTTANTYLVFNSIEKVKKKWYQTFLFKIVLVVASVAISFVTAGAGLGLAGGVLGNNLTLGLSLGASAAAAAVVGATANAIAAMVLTTVISQVSTKVFGEKLGAILGTLITFVSMRLAANFGMNGDFNVDWVGMFNPENLLNLTNSVGDAYSRWLAADTSLLYEEMGNLADENADAMAEIEKISSSILGMTGINFDPMILTDTTEYFGESQEAFLGRTLMTGSEIVELSNSMIENFADISLELPTL